MLNLALVALLAGSLASGSPDGDRGKDKDKASTQAPETAQPTATDDARAITNDTYSFGRPSDLSPLKFWVAYAFGESEGSWQANGEDREYAAGGIPGASGDIVSQRAIVGAQINVLHFPAFKFGVGGQLVAGINTFQFGEDGVLGGLTGLEEFDSGWGLQQVKVFGTARGRVVGIHGGYLFDLADEATSFGSEDFDEGNSFPLSDERDAIFVGADFDYPSEVVRLFGGVDYFMLQDDSETGDEGGEVTPNGDDGNNVLVWNAGLGLRFSVFEIGAAVQVQTTLVQGQVARLSDDPGRFSGGHAGTIAPYLRIAPPSLPVSIFVKGAVLNEYTDYGYAIGGANDIKPSLGFTAGLTVGFN